MGIFFTPAERIPFDILPLNPERLFVALLIDRGAARRETVYQVRLRRDIIFIGAVPVYMVGGKVRHYGEVADKFLRPMQLEAGELKNDKVIILSRGVGHGVADVAARHHGIAHLLQKIADHRGGRRLAVAAGDADHDSRKVRRDEIQLARDRDPLRARRLDYRSLWRNAGADDDLIGLKHTFRVAAAFPLDPLLLKALDGRGIRLLYIGDEYLRAKLRGEFGERASADASAYHRYPFSSQLHILRHLHQQPSRS